MTLAAEKTISAVCCSLCVCVCMCACSLPRITVGTAEAISDHISASSFKYPSWVLGSRRAIEEQTPGLALLWSVNSCYTDVKALPLVDSSVQKGTRTQLQTWNRRGKCYGYASENKVKPFVFFICIPKSIGWWNYGWLAGGHQPRNLHSNCVYLPL